MCGILGVSNSSKAKLAKPEVAEVFCKAAMDSLETRGYQSWGVTLIEPGTSATLSVRALGRITKVSSLDFSNASSVSQAICHTRIASAGAVTLDNAQPIVLGSGVDGDEIVMVHNGTINRQRLESSLADDFLNLRAGRSSDSQAIAWFLRNAALLGEVSVSDTVYPAGYFRGRGWRVLETLGVYDSAALIWASTVKPSEQWLARVSDSPLVVGSLAGSIVSASTWAALDAGAVAIGHKSVHAICELSEGDVIKISGGEIEATFDLDLPPAPPPPKRKARIVKAGEPYRTAFYDKWFDDDDDVYGHNYGFNYGRKF